MFKNKTIVLIGLMGSGKTTLGKKLAKRLLLPFFDSDKFIEEQTGVSIATIFDIEGEEAFRARESKAIAHLMAEKGCVIATGGGAILREENRKNILRADFVIYLKASPKVLWSRLQEDRTRPLLQVDNPLTRLEKLYAERHPLYESLANLTVDGDTFDSSLAVRFIMKELENANS